MSVQAALPFVLSYEPPADSKAAVQRLHSWILFGGVVYGAASCIPSLSWLITRLDRDGNPFARPLSGAEWQNYAQSVAALCAYGLLAATSFLALRGTIRRPRLRGLLIVATTLAVTIAMYGWIMFVVRLTSRASFRPNDAVVYFARTASYLLWPFVMLWTSNDRASVDADVIRRRLWWGVAALGLFVTMSSVADEWRSFRLLLSLYSISWRVVDKFLSCGMFAALIIVAIIAACRGTSRALRWVVGGLLIGIWLLGTLNLMEFFENARTLQDIWLMMIGQLVAMLMISMPILIALLCASTARTRDAVPDVQA